MSDSIDNKNPLLNKNEPDIELNDLTRVNDQADNNDESKSFNDVNESDGDPIPIDEDTPFLAQNKDQTDNSTIYNNADSETQSFLSQATTIPNNNNNLDDELAETQFIEDELTEIEANNRQQTTLRNRITTRANTIRDTIPNLLKISKVFLTFLLIMIVILIIFTSIGTLEYYEVIKTINYHFFFY
jgi:hypothetical protein